MAKYWVVEVSYPFDGSFVMDDRLEALVGKPRSGSGAGFGMRDIDWTFTDEAEATTVGEKLIAYSLEHREANLHVYTTPHDDEE